MSLCIVPSCVERGCIGDPLVVPKLDTYVGARATYAKDLREGIRIALKSFWSILLVGDLTEKHLLGMELAKAFFEYPSCVFEKLELHLAASVRRR